MISALLMDFTSPLKILFFSWKSKKHLLFLALLPKLNIVLCSDNSRNWKTLTLTNKGLLVPPTPLYWITRIMVILLTMLSFMKETKHIEIDCHFVRRHVLQGIVLLDSISFTVYLAALFTKSPSAWFQRLLCNLPMSTHCELEVGCKDTEDNPSREHFVK